MASIHQYVTTYRVESIYKSSWLLLRFLMFVCMQNIAFCVVYAVFCGSCRGLITYGVNLDEIRVVVVLCFLGTSRLTLVGVVATISGVALLAGIQVPLEPVIEVILALDLA